MIPIVHYSFNWAQCGLSQNLRLVLLERAHLSPLDGPRSTSVPGMASMAHQMMVLDSQKSKSVKTWLMASFDMSKILSNQPPVAKKV